MAIRTLKPTSPARRYLTYVTRDEITKQEPEKGLLVTKRRTSGRNNYGRITVRHRGRGHKRMLRQVDFRREKTDIPAKVAAIEYDPNRSARLALLHYRDGEKRYIVAPLGCPGTPCPCATSRSARSCTTSSCSPGAAASCAAAREPRPSCWPRRASAPR
jgi:ribosomal protein L2